MSEYISSTSSLCGELSCFFFFFCFFSASFFTDTDFLILDFFDSSIFSNFQTFGLCQLITYFLIPLSRFSCSNHPSQTFSFRSFSCLNQSPHTCCLHLPPELLGIRSGKMPGRSAASGVGEKKVVVIEYDKLEGTYLELGYWDEDIGEERFAAL